MKAILELLYRLKSLSEPDRQVDDAVGAFDGWHYVNGLLYHDTSSGQRYRILEENAMPRYTASVNAAIRLVERINRANCYRIEKVPPSGLSGPYWASCGLPGQQEQGTGPTASIALLIALFEHQRVSTSTHEGETK